MPETTKYIKQVMGLGNPQLYEPLTVHLMRAATSQFGGAIDLERDAHLRLMTLGYAYKQLEQDSGRQLKQEAQGLMNPQSYSTYMKEKYPEILPATNAQIYLDSQARLQGSQTEIQGQMQQTGLASQFLSGQLDAGQYRARLLNLEQNIKDTNRSIQLGYSRYLQMATGAKSSDEARAKAGVKLQQGR